MFFGKQHLNSWSSHTTQGSDRNKNSQTFQLPIALSIKKKWPQNTNYGFISPAKKHNFRRLIWIFQINIVHFVNLKVVLINIPLTIHICRINSVICMTGNTESGRSFPGNYMWLSIKKLDYDDWELFHCFVGQMCLSFTPGKSYVTCLEMSHTMRLLVILFTTSQLINTLLKITRSPPLIYQ